MPPKPEGKKGKVKENLAMLNHCDIHLKNLKRGLTSTKANTQAIEPFIKKVDEKLKAITNPQDPDLDVPVFPCFVHERMEFDTCMTLFNAFTADGNVYPWLRQVSLYHCHIGDEGAMVVADFIRNYTPEPSKNPFGIELLELPENDISAKGAQYLGRMLAQNETVKTLILDFNPLGDDGVGLLGDGLKWNSTLEVLSMQHCDVGPEGGELIGKYIVRSSSVKNLSVRGNPLGPHGVTHIARSLAKNAYLEELDLADTSFGIDLVAIEALRDGIEGNESLTAVDLNFNSLVPAGVQLLLEMLKPKHKITKFVLFERISEVVFKEVIDTLQNNQKMMKKKKKKGKAAPAAPPPEEGADAPPPPPPDAAAAA